MRKITLLLLCATVSVSTFAIRTSVIGSKNLKNRSEEQVFQRPGEKPKFFETVKRTSDVTTLMLPGTLELYSTPDGLVWDKDLRINYTYDQAGHMLSETMTDMDGVVTKITYTYNENGMKASYLEQVIEAGNPINIQKKIWKYDSVVTNYVISQEYQNWNPLTRSWEQTYLHTKVIERNVQGNVESVEVRLYFAGEDGYDVVERYEMTYNDRLLVSTIVKKTLQEIDTQIYELAEAFRFVELEWLRCGQVLSTEDLSTGTNLAKSYEIWQDGVLVATNKTTYSPDGELFSSKLVNTYDDGTLESFTYTTLDENDSYSSIYMMQYEEEYMGDKYIETYDNYKTMLEGSMYMTEDGTNWELAESQKFEVTYDGNKLTEIITSMYNAETYEYETIQKEVFSDHHYASLNNTKIDGAIFFDSINDLIVLDETASSEYSVYTTTGSLVMSGKTSGKIDASTLPQGIYIVNVTSQQGKATLKFVK